MSQITYTSKVAADAVSDPKQILWVGDGEWLVKTGDDMDASNIPQTLSSRQFWLAIEDAGLTAAIKAAVAASPARVQIEVAQATEFARNNPLLNQMAAAIGKSSADIDNIFMYGEVL